MVSFFNPTQICGTSHGLAIADSALIVFASESTNNSADPDEPHNFQPEVPEKNFSKISNQFFCIYGAVLKKFSRALLM